MKYRESCVVGQTRDVKFFPDISDSNPLDISVIFLMSSMTQNLVIAAMTKQKIAILSGS